MCKRRDSIAAVSLAADHLAEVCEAAIHKAATPKFSPDDPAAASIAKTVHDAFRNLTTTPVDMAVQLRMIK